MRLKECSTNYHASSLRRRAARQDKPDDAPRRARGKKDRKRWCGGHVGREHQPKCFDYRELKHRNGFYAEGSAFSGWKILACTACGKELDHWFPWDDTRLASPKPAWVTE